MQHKTKGRRSTWIPVARDGADAYFPDLRASTSIRNAVHFWKHGQQLAAWIGH